MKTLTMLVTTFITTAAIGADYVRFAEQLSDTNTCIIDDGEPFCFVVTRNKGGCTARLTLPGLERVTFGPGTPLRISLGGLEFDTDLGEADVLSADRAGFYFEYLDDNDRPQRYGGIAITRTGNVLSLAAGFLALDASIVAEDGQWDAGGMGTVPFSLRVGDVAFGRTVYFKAVATQRPPPDPESDPLRTIIVQGKADFTKPTVAIIAPKNRARGPAEMVTLQGTAKDNGRVTSVLYRVGGNPWASALGTSNWTATVSVPVGTNVVQVKSVDGEAQESRVVSRTVIRTP